MARLPGFVGGSYQRAQEDQERSVNWFPEKVESPGGQQKASLILVQKPGLASFVTLPAGKNQAFCYVNGRAFACAGGVFYEIFSNKTYQSRGTVTLGATQMCANQNQVLIASGGTGFVFTLATNTFAAVSAAGWPQGASNPQMIDGYGIVLEPNSQAFAISGLNDFTSWNALDFGDAEGETGNVIGMLADHRLLWLMATNHGEAYYDSGNANFPFSRLEGAFMEQGLEVQATLQKFDNSFAWLGANEQGTSIVWKANGYTPQRISTHAVEAIIQSYSTVSDASGYTYQEAGHTFYRLDFPSANNGLGATWVFDASSNFWHERTFWDANMGVERADLARFHMVAWNGIHLVGDYRNGNIYIQSQQYATDAGAAIKRIRQTPDDSIGGNYQFYPEFRLLCSVGVGLDGGLVPGSNPQISLEFSDDGGKKWKRPRFASLGALGKFNTLVRWRILGRSRNRAWRLVCSEPCLVSLFDADVDKHT